MQQTGTRITITPFPSSSELNPLTSRSQRTLEKKRSTSLLDRIISIRVVLIIIMLITVVSLAIGLILLNVKSSNSIVDTLSVVIQADVSSRIIDQLFKLFSGAQTEGTAALTNWKVIPNFQPHGNGTNPFLYAPFIGEYLWSMVRQYPTGYAVEFISLDGSAYGAGAFPNFANAYWIDYIDGALISTGWVHDLFQPLAKLNFSSKPLYSYPYGKVYDFIKDPHSQLDYNSSSELCTTPPQWDKDLFIYIGMDLITYDTIYQLHTVCNSNDTLIGYLAVAIGLSSISHLLAEITSKINGYIFIMDSRQQLISTSTHSLIAEVYPNVTYTRQTIENTQERWVQDVRGVLDGYGEQSQTVLINGTSYQLSVTRWNQFKYVDWYIVKLFKRDQFLGNSHEFFIEGIITATCVSFAAISVVMLVTWATTKPLFILAGDLQRMARLDLEISDMSTPRLLEVSKLYRSVTSMYIALRSFKQFVPIQVISKIINSEKEVTAELHSANVTIMFQDIEGFTTLSERVDTVRLAKLTSEYMETMCEIICRHGGTIDKYIGDCIMSLFNAPEPLASHPAAAAAAATECIKTLVQKNAEWKITYGCEMNCRIGINTGKVLIGNMGSGYRMNYTAFGDNVNVAARLEGVNKHYGTRIMVSKSVFSALPLHTFVTRKLAKVRVSGKDLPTSIYEIRGSDSPALVLHLFHIYEKALSLYKNRELFSALDEINKALEHMPLDKASIQLKSRINEAIVGSPLAEDWTYIEDLVKL